MHIGIIGSGNVGGTVARLFVGAGHQVAMSNSRGPDSLASLVESLGSQARAASIEEASSFGEVVLVAIPFGKYLTIPATPLEGKVVVDAMNYYAQRDGRIEFGDSTSTELLSQHLRGSRVVKAFNSLYYGTLATKSQPEARVEDRLAVFVAGDDAGAKAIVSRLIEDIGFAPVDTGSLHDGGLLLQPGGALYNHPTTAREARTVLGELR